MKKLPKNLQKTFLPIYYNYNESNLLSNYKSRVEAVTLAMRENPQLVVEVSSYSDCRGKREYNLKLSEQRNQTELCRRGLCLDGNRRMVLDLPPSRKPGGVH